MSSCTPCPVSEYCLGGNKCLIGRGGAGCALCEDKYHAPYGTDCVPCPDSMLADIFLGLVFVAFSIFMYSLYKVLGDAEDEHFESKFRSKSATDFQKHIRKGSRIRVRRVTAIINISLAHNITLNFVLPIMALPHLPQWLHRGSIYHEVYVY